MRLTLQTDYGFRILIYLAVHEGAFVSARDIAEAYGIPLNHVKKIITHLVKGGYILSVRGRNGGITLGRKAADIRLGTVAQYLDQEAALLRCMKKDIKPEDGFGFCLLFRGCHLKPLLAQAQKAFLETMERFTLVDIIGNCECKLLKK